MSAPESAVTGWAAIPNWMVRDPKVTPNMLAVYCVVQSHAGPGGTTALRHKTIAGEAGVSVDTVKRSTKALNDLGVLWWEGTAHGGGFGANVYHALQERHEDLVGMHHSPHPSRSATPDPAPTLVQHAAPTPEPESADSSGFRQQNVRSSAPRVVQHAAPTPVQTGGVGAHSTQVGAHSTEVGAHSTTEVEQSFVEESLVEDSPPTSSQERQPVRTDDEGFSEFWGRYPPTRWKAIEGKTKSRGIWFRLTPEERELTMVALAAYMATAAWIERRDTIPGPQRWLESEPWLEARFNNLPKRKLPPELEWMRNG